MTLDLLIPVYDPHASWAEELIVQYRMFLARLPENFSPRLIIVNDGSSRDLEKDAQYISEILPELHWISYTENQGKGYALRRAASVSQGELVMYTDYDFPYTYGSMARMIAALDDPKVDAVVGKRDDSYYAHISPRRRRISTFLKGVNSLIFRLPTNDTQCGLKAFRASVRETFLSTRTDRYLIDVEFLKKLARSKARVAVEPVKLREGVVLSKISNLSLIKEAFNYLVIMLFG